MPLPKYLTTITPVSKWALIIFVALLPAWGFFIGTVYMGTVTYLSNNAVVTTEPAPVPQDKTTLVSQALRKEFDECVADMKLKLPPNGGYDPGSILAAFSSTTTFASAEHVLASYGLAASTSTEAVEGFKAHHWLTIAVPAGQEFRWACILKKDSSVSYASLNQTFSMHE